MLNISPTPGHPVDDEFSRPRDGETHQVSCQPEPGCSTPLLLDSQSNKYIQKGSETKHFSIPIKEHRNIRNSTEPPEDELDSGDEEETSFLLLPLSPSPAYRVPSNTPFIPSTIRFPNIPVFDGLDNDLPDPDPTDFPSTSSPFSSSHNAEFWLDDDEEDEGAVERFAAQAGPGEYGRDRTSAFTRMADLSFMSDGPESADTSYDVSFGPYTPSPSRAGAQGDFAFGGGAVGYGARGPQEPGVGLGILGLAEATEMSMGPWSNRSKGAQEIVGGGRRGRADLEDGFDLNKPPAFSPHRDSESFNILRDQDQDDAESSFRFNDDLSFPSPGNILSSIPECDSWSELGEASDAGFVVPSPTSASAPGTRGPTDDLDPSFSFPNTNLGTSHGQAPPQRPNLKRAVSLPKPRRTSAFFLSSTTTAATANSIDPSYTDLSTSGMSTAEGSVLGGTSSVAMSTTALRIRSASSPASVGTGTGAFVGEGSEGLDGDGNKGMVYRDVFAMGLANSRMQLGQGLVGGRVGDMSLDGGGGKRSAHRRWRL